MKNFVIKNRLSVGVVFATIVVLASGVLMVATDYRQEIDSAIRVQSQTIAAPRATTDASTTDIATATPAPTPSPPVAVKPTPESLNKAEKPKTKDSVGRKELAPLAVRSVTTYGNNILNCNIGPATIHTQYAVIVTNYAKGGAIRWQLEGRQNGAIQVLVAGVGTTEDLGGTYQTPNLFSYSTPRLADDSAIRVHITAPNDIASAWYSPASCPNPQM